MRPGAWLLGAAVAAFALPASSAASVAVVGDSLGVGTEPHLRAALPGVAIAADVVKGRPSSEGPVALPALLGPQVNVVVFDLGTNDDLRQADALAANLVAARSLAGDRCFVLATLNRPPLLGVSVDGLNAAIRDFAAATPRAVVVDWNAEVRTNPALLAGDGVHGTPDGYARRGRLFAAAVRSCSAGGGGTGAGVAGIPAPRRRAPAPPPDLGRRDPAPRPPRGPRTPPASGPDLSTATDGAMDGALAKGAVLMAAAGEQVRAALTPRADEPVLGARH